MDGAGKSTLLQTLLGQAPESTMPTFGFNNESLTRGGFDVDVFDLGGGRKIRGIWKAYMADVHGCAFVVDSSDDARLEECRDVFAETLRDPHLSGKPVVIFANKQDAPGAKTTEEVATALGLTTLQNERHHVVPCTALRTTEGGKGDKGAADTGVDDGMRWMLEKVGEDWDELNPRVAKEAEAARRKEEELKKERIKRGEEARRERLEQERLEEERLEKERLEKEKAESEAPSEAIVEPFQMDAVAESPTPMKRTLIPVEDIDSPEGGTALFGAVTVSPGAFKEQVD